MAKKTSKSKGGKRRWFLKSKRPVSLPESAALTSQEHDFQAYLTKSFREDGENKNIAGGLTEVADTDTIMGDKFEHLDLLSATLEATPSTVGSSTMKEESEVGDDGVDQGDVPSGGGPFMDGLLYYRRGRSMPSLENRMRTENGDFAFQSTINSPLDLFTELEEVISGPRLHDLLNSFWQEDPLTTLKIIFNCRSIHLGKASRNTFYRCASWLAAYHPHTVLANMQWLSRPVIEKKVLLDFRLSLSDSAFTPHNKGSYIYICSKLTNPFLPKVLLTTEGGEGRCGPG